jgi:5-methylcytosine-specific restriction endonuclease McrA
VVFVLGKKKKPLMPCTERRARLLLSRKRAVVVRLYPFTIRLKDRVDGDLQPIRLSVDPGSKFSGISITREKEEKKEDSTPKEVGRSSYVLFLIELLHRGQAIRDALVSRSSFRRSRRNRKLRYRAPRFLNRTRNRRWLAPSLRHRVETLLSWVKRLQKLAPISQLSQELVRFDFQATTHPEISGVEYQQGTLAGYELREYLLEKWGRKCSYCDSQNIPLEIEHVIPRSKGGTHRASNLTLACRPCNQAKGNLRVEEFLKKDHKRLNRILKNLQTPLKDAAAVNTTRWTLFEALKTLTLPLEVGSGGLTKWNRIRFQIPKTHALDAACVGKREDVQNWNCPILSIRCTGRGSYQRTRLTKYGFPRGYLMRKKSVQGFQTGDLVHAEVSQGRHKGTYRGRVAIRASGSFNIQTQDRLIQGISHRHCRLIWRADGYSYSQKIALQRKECQKEHASRATLSLLDLKVEVSRTF